MIRLPRKIVRRLPPLETLLEGLTEIDAVRAERDAAVAQRSALQQRIEALEKQVSERDAALERAAREPWFRQRPDTPHSRDLEPWNHPALNPSYLKRFRAYSGEVWRLALDHHQRNPRPLRLAFAVNMAQNMYKWARIAQQLGVSVELFAHPQDNVAISAPEWEEFDGEYGDILDGPGFLAKNPEVRAAVPYRKIPMDGLGLAEAYGRWAAGDRLPLHRLLVDSPGVRHEPLMAHESIYPYLAWARALNEFDAVFVASSPIPVYASGRPYIAQSVGGDLQFDCGRTDSYGEASSLAFNGARFLSFTNPLTLGHCRRLSFVNGLYLPYPMDDDRYCPGEPVYRAEWVSKYGGEVYILTTARIDSAVKGNAGTILESVANVARQRPDVRFVFLAWGNDVAAMRERVAAAGLAKQVVFLSPVGKKRLIDYYRSCDIVLDQLTWGYYGATGLEAAAVGKPLVMKIRPDQYGPFYEGDVAPVQNVTTGDELAPALISLIDDPARRKQAGEAMRSWVVRTHGRERAGRLMVALLQFAADRVSLPADLVNPLRDPLTDEERAYHAKCVPS